MAAVLGGAVSGIPAGCQRAVNVPQGPLSETPVVVDQAMQLREWEPVSAYYQNPRFIAGPTGFNYETPYEPFQWYYGLTDTPLFLAQTLGLPIALIMTPPWSEVTYAGATFEPTYYAMPPLPPSAYDSGMAPSMPPEPSVYDEPPAPAPPAPVMVPSQPPEAPAAPSRSAPSTAPSARTGR